MLALGFLYGCGSEEKKTETGTTATEYRGPDCDVPETDDDRRASVAVPDQCETIQYALESVQCADGYVTVTSDAVVMGSSDFSAAGCGLFENLTIASSDDAPAFLVPATTSEEVMMSIPGTHTVTLDNLYYLGLGRPEFYGSETEMTLLQIDGGATVTGTDLVFQNMMNGVAVSDATYADNGGIYEAVNGTAIYAGSGSDVSLMGIEINGQVHSDKPIIHAETASSVLIAGATVANSDTNADVVSIDADYFRVYGGYYFDNVTPGFVLNLSGGNPTDELGAEIDNQFYNNYVVNNSVGSAGVIKMDGCGEATGANNTVANNLSVTGGMDTVIDSTDACGDGITTWTNNFIGYQGDLVGEQIINGFGDSNVDVSYNVFTGNGSAPIPQDDEFTNVEGDPFENGEELDVFDYDSCYVNASEYAHEDGDPYLDSTGNPETKFNNPGENVSDIGADGGKYRDILRAQGDRVDTYPWFDEDVCVSE